MHRQPHYRLPAWQRRTLVATGALLLATGVVWLLLHYVVAADGLPHPLEAWTLRLHGLAAFGGLFMLGALAAAHVPRGWHMSRRPRWEQQRGTGLALLTLGALLALTGYLLYYFAPEALRPALGWLHSGAGVVMTGVFLVHR
jgi:hypothetical protein